MTTNARQSNVRNRDWWLGFALALPFGIPHNPYYLVGFGVFLIGLVMARPLIETRVFCLTGGLVVVGLVSNIFTPHPSLIDFPRALFTTFFFFLFLFGYCITDPESFLAGYTKMVTIFAALVIGVFILGHASLMGPLLFVLPDQRLWGAAYFPDWPNFFAFMLSIGFLLSSIWYRNRWAAFLTGAAALLTTSRTALLAITFWVLAYCYEKKKLMLLATVILVLGIIAGGVAFFAGVSPELAARLTTTSDREEIYTSAGVLITERPWLGQGSVLFDESIGHTGHASYHNTYLDLVVRFGVLGIALFTLLIFPRGLDRRHHLTYWAVIAFFLLGSVFQNFLKHPHLFMFYAVWMINHEHFLEVKNP